MKLALALRIVCSARAFVLVKEVVPVTIVMLCALMCFAVPARAETISACASKSTGQLRLVLQPSECKKNEQFVTWNIAGPKGDKGTPGDPCPPLHGAVGSWFGHAVPVPGQTICPPGAPGCPVPREIVLLFTINADGTFVGTDSNSIGGARTTAHGQWTQVTTSSIKAELTLLQSAESGIFIGGYKDGIDATVVSPDEMQGSINMKLYSYADSAGAVILDSNGFPTPSPLYPPTSCSITSGCTNLGQFSFIVRRVKVH